MATTLGGFIAGNDGPGAPGNDGAPGVHGAGAGPITLGGAISDGPAPTMSPDVVTAADQVHALTGIDTVGDIAQGAGGATAPTKEFDATNELAGPKVAATGEGEVNQTLPQAGQGIGPSPAIPTLGKG